MPTCYLLCASVNLYVSGSGLAKTSCCLCLLGSQRNVVMSTTSTEYGDTYLSRMSGDNVGWQFGFARSQVCIQVFLNLEIIKQIILELQSFNEALNWHSFILKVTSELSGELRQIEAEIEEIKRLVSTLEIRYLVTPWYEMLHDSIKQTGMDVSLI